MRKFLFFKVFFRQFLSELSIRLKMVLALKFSLIAAKYNAYKSVHCVESIKLMTIVKAKMGQN